MKKPTFSSPFLKFSSFLVVLTLVTACSGVIPFATEAATTVFSRNLSIGSVGADVRLLQVFLNSDPDTRISLTGPGSPGNETLYFGPATRAAVKRFQEKYRQEVLIPAGLFQATGYVGALTRLKISTIVAAAAKNSLTVAITEKDTTAASSTAPRIYSVNPSRVQAGNTVVVTGEGFTPTGNTVILGDGPLSKQFNNLSSPDGKTLTFTYQPPLVHTMTEAEIRALPPKVFAKINDPIVARGQTLSDVIASPLSGIMDINDYTTFLKNNNRSINDVYHFFHIIVENSKGKGMSQTALLYGLPNLPFQTATNGAANDFLSYVSKAVNFFIPTASAQVPGGGFDVGIVLFCTCNGGVLVWLEDYAGAGTDFYWFYPGFVPIAGTGLVTSMWIGFYIPYVGECWIGEPPWCAPIIANVPLNPWGASM